MGRLIVIEGLDGAGKRTLAEKLTAAFAEQGARTATMAFPRYGRSVTADLVRDGLYGKLGPLGDSVYGSAILYALDRQGAAADIQFKLDTADVLLLDRYISSNAAYGAARLHEDADGEFVQWVKSIEVDRFELPLPHAQLLLKVTAATAKERSEHRERTENREQDKWEADADLQARCAEVYDGLAASAFLSPWHVIDGAAETDLATLSKHLLTP
ncbi:Thymidylate kinase [Alloactinosynnema sp. L-07]|uniref:dTMP kinase n=1 Tax=Alloactinosynnema sp. L-07 TaxID=1653480 RepID=UPI00065EF831|nr:dTMP kinase [Alloactinosynnema sp. L-07]CRK59710.1 Thymidylate kinase [Alloactinosynnema sp. L-07]